MTPSEFGAIGVRDCERVQSAWFDARAFAASGRVWDDGPLHWTDGPDGGNLMFPRTIPADGLDRGVASISARPVGAWLSADVEPAPLLAAGFERGWAPWWMTAPLPGAAATRAAAPALVGRRSDDPQRDRGGLRALLAPRLPPHR